MKRLLALLLITLGSSLFSLCHAQLTLLHKFNDTTGQHPNGPLIQLGNLLYGMTPAGGAYDSGCIFTIDTNGSNFKDIFDFNGTNGSSPQAGLVLSGNKFYGMAAGGGAHGNGCIFSIDTTGNGYIDRFDFNGTNGSDPVCNLLPSGNILYGMTYAGGANDSGCVFSIDTTGSHYTDLLDFTGTNGRQPLGSLILAGNVLYGTANAGGQFYKGCVFSIHTNGSSYRDLYDFTQDTFKAASPIGPLCLSGAMLYGVTTANNNHNVILFGNHGMVFKIDTNGTGFKVIDSINATPSSLIMVNNLFYFMTGFQPVIDNPGTSLWSLDTAGNLTDLYDFTFHTINHRDSAGYGGCNLLMNSGNMIYGTNVQGGDANDDGTIFSFNLTSIATSTKQLSVVRLASGESCSVYPNPSNGIFTIVGTQNFVSTLDVYTVLGEKVYSATLPHNPPTGGALSEIDLSSKSDGVYFYRVISDTGNLIGVGKLIIQK